MKTGMTPQGKNKRKTAILAIKVNWKLRFTQLKKLWTSSQTFVLFFNHTYICQGAKNFLLAEYKYCAIFIVLMSALLFFSVEKKLGQAWTTVAFAAGAITSLIAGYIGMIVAVNANGRVALQT